MSSILHPDVAADPVVSAHVFGAVHTDGELPIGALTESIPLPDVGLPEGFKPNPHAPRAYFSFDWKKRFAPPALLGQLKEGGYECYPWECEGHWKDVAKQVQAKRIFEWLRTSEVFVWDITDMGEDRSYCSSRALWNFAIGCPSIRLCIIIDRKLGERPFSTAVGRRQHPAICGIFGKVASQAAISPDSSSPFKTNIVDNDAAALRFITTTPSAPFPPLSSKPLSYSAPTIPPTSSLIFYASKSFESWPGAVHASKLTERRAVLYPLTTMTQSGAEPTYKLQDMVQWLRHEKCLGFIWDLTHEDRTECDMKELWSWCVGASIPTVIVDPKHGEHPLPKDSHIPRHPAVCGMASKLVGQDLNKGEAIPGGPLFVPVVDSVEAAACLLGLHSLSGGGGDGEVEEESKAE